MTRTVKPAGPPEFRNELAAVRDDPRIKSFALRLAGDLDLARDALNETYLAVARVQHPEHIDDLRKYFCRTLRRIVSRLRKQLGAIVIEDFDRIAEGHQDKPGCHPLPPPSVAETVISGLLAQDWLEQFTADREELASRVPGRSPRAERYRATIVAAAERLIVAIATADVCDADSNPALSAMYSQWFAEPGCAENTLHQRFSRARADIRALLRTIISRDDLQP